MDKFIAFFLLTFITIGVIIDSCTPQQRARHFGGNATIELSKGQRLIMTTFKNNDIWYLTEEMDSDYTPKTKTLYESSSYGVIEGSVTFIESK